MLKSLIPKTLFGRNLLLIVGLIVFSLLVSAIVFRYAVQGPRITQIAAMVASHVKATHVVMKSLDAQQRTVFVKEIQRSPTIEMVAQTQRPGIEDPRPAWIVRSFINQFKTHLPAEYVVFWQSEPQEQLWISIDLPDERYWMGLRAQRLLGSTSLSLIGVVVFAVAAALMGALLIQRRINRPLTQLAQAAQLVGQGQLSVVLPEEGPQEIARVSQRFNQMLASLAQLDRDRHIMLAGVSHDLRTPLAKMGLALELLRSNPDPQLIDDMYRYIESVDTIVGQFLAYASVGNDEPLQAVDLNQLLRTLVDEYARSGTQFEFEPRPTPVLQLRPVAMQCVLTNLMQNAQRYGRAPFSVSVEAKDQSVIVCINDSGDGIDAQRSEEIKKPFVRLDAARTTAGSGLGLAIADRVVQLHGGRLTLANRAGGGLQACIELPVHI